MPLIYFSQHFPTCRHFLYHSRALGQFVFPKFSAPLHSRRLQKRLLRGYQELHAAVHHAGPGGNHKMHCRSDSNFVQLVLQGDGWELLAAYDPLTEVPQAVSLATRTAAWCKAQEAELFAPL